MVETTAYRVRLCTGGLLLVLAWIYPYTSGGSTDALQQLFMLAMFSLAAIAFGTRAIPLTFWGALSVGAALMLATPNPYWGRIIAGVAGLFLAGLAAHTGSHLRCSPAGLVAMLFAIVISAFLNAIEGLMQWSDLTGELYRWMVIPEKRGIAFGAFRQRNLFATFLCVGAVCVVWLVHLKKMTEPMAWLAAAVLITAVAASGSRTGGLEVAILAVLALLFRKRNSPVVTRLFVGQLVLLAGAMAVLPLVANGLGFDFVPGAAREISGNQNPRLAIWSNSLDLILQQPFSGWGWRDMGYAHYVTLFDVRHNELLENAHNLPLQLALEFGVPATFGFFVLIVWAVWVAKPWRLNALRQLEGSPYKADATFAWAILLIIVFHSFLEYPLWTSGYLFLAGLFMGYALPTRSVNSSFYNTASPYLAKLLAVGLFTLAAVGWQQYARVLQIYKTPFTNNKEVQRTAILAAYNNASNAWLFQEQLDLVKLTKTSITPENAADMRKLAETLLHSSAEPMIIQPLLLSLWHLGDMDALRFHAVRFCQAFPEAFERWYVWPNNKSMTAALGSKSQLCKQ
jgi:O-antigen ligase